MYHFSHHPLRFFISSTDKDLRAYRTAILNVLPRMDQFGIDMRFLGAQATRTATQVSIEYIDRSDVIILLIAWRYGTLDPSFGKSITHLEFERARHLNRPLFAYLAHPDTENLQHPYESLFPLELRDPDHEVLLKDFRQEVMSNGRVVDFFTTPEDLASKVAIDVGKYLREIAGNRTQPITAPYNFPHNLPPKIPNFVGRASILQQITHDLYQAQSTGNAIVINGLGA
jgi:hypothetical protein